MRKLIEKARKADVSDEPNICDGKAMCHDDGSMWDHLCYLCIICKFIEVFD